jgi:hypothetical protein
MCCKGRRGELEYLAEVLSNICHWLLVSWTMPARIEEGLSEVRFGEPAHLAKPEAIYNIDSL